MWTPHILVPTFILICGVINDIKSRKVRNWLVLALAGASLLFSLTAYGTSALSGSFFSMLTAILICLPFVLTKIMGAGDMKLFAAFAIAVSIPAVINSFIYSLFWGTLLGILSTVLSGQFKAMIKNAVSIASLKNGEATNLHQIPYTVALLFGWLTFVTLSRFPGLQIWS